MSTSGSGGPPLDKPVTAEEVEYLITELEECRKKAKILEENSYSFHHWEFEFLFLKDTIAAKVACVLYFALAIPPATQATAKAVFDA